MKQYKFSKNSFLMNLILQIWNKTTAVIWISEQKDKNVLKPAFVLAYLLPQLIHVLCFC